MSCGSCANSTFSGGGGGSGNFRTSSFNSGSIIPASSLNFSSVQNAVGCQPCGNGGGAPPSCCPVQTTLALQIPNGDYTPVTVTQNYIFSQQEFRSCRLLSESDFQYQVLWVTPNCQPKPICCQTPCGPRPNLCPPGPAPPNYFVLLPGTVTIRINWISPSYVSVNVTVSIALLQELGIEVTLGSQLCVTFEMWVQPFNCCTAAQVVVASPTVG